MTTTTERAEDVAARAEQDGGPSSWRVLQRVVLPADRDIDVLPLYVDGAQTVVQPDAEADAAVVVVPPAAQVHPEDILDRRSMVVTTGNRLSFGTYFNAFPASYWRRWTTVREVRLRLRVAGAGTVLLYRSNARGNPQRLEARTVDTAPGEPVELTFDLSLAAFADGGWYWFDLAAGQRDIVLESAEWCAQTERTTPGRATVAITTFNRPDYCAALLQVLGRAPAEETEAIGRVLVIDQGTQRVRDDAGFPEAAQALGDRLEILEQGNLGGSGGFARGMLEASTDGSSDYVLLLDDDVLVEPEGIARAVAFADLAATPTIVGGHMFSMYERSVLHAVGEGVNRYRWFWGPVNGTIYGHDFKAANLRQTTGLHRRVDVDYNGWWMCLIPTQVVRRLGLSLPVFIKWDDAEYGLRAKAAGFPTVTLPGAAVWHVPWTDKDDTVDWQAYFHARNRLLVALLYSPYDRGGRVVYESLNMQLKHALALQYSAAELRLLALEDLLRGPERLHQDLPGKLTQVRSIRQGYHDAQVAKEPGSFPEVRRAKPPKKGREPSEPRSGLGRVTAAATGALRQVLPVKHLSTEHPEAGIAAMDAKWWLLAQFDSAVVSTADGTGASWHKRDRRTFLDLMRRSVVLHERVAREWPRLRETYREALGDVVSPQSWEHTFGLSGRPQSQQQPQSQPHPDRSEQR